MKMVFLPQAHEGNVKMESTGEIDRVNQCKGQLETGGGGSNI